MVKNIPTIERSTKIRFGKHANDNQAENTIVINASDAPIAASTPGSVYMTPLRVAELAGANFFAYHAQSAELVDSGVATDLLGGITLQNATTVGNTTANVVEFNHPTTSFVTSSNVGIANTLPTHALSVADKVFIKGAATDIDDLRIVGNTKTDRLSTAGNEVVIDKDKTNKIQVSGVIHTGDIQATAHVAIANTNPQDLFTLGADGQTVMNVPTQSTYALETTGNINAQYYHGDGGLLSNLNLQIVTDKASITTNTLDLTHPTTSLKAYSNIVVDDYIFGNISGSNLITASEINAYIITAANQITSPLTQSDTIVGNNEVVGPDIIGTSGIYGEIKGSNVVTASKVSGSIGLYGDILGSNVVSADKVIVDVGGIFGEIKGSNNISADNITATSISGSGSSVTDIGTGNITTGVLDVARGGTGIGDTYTIGDIPYASAPSTLSTLGVSSATGGQFLRLNPGKTAPIWSDVPLTLDEVLESQTGVSNVSDAVITLTKASGVALEVTDAQVALNGTGNVLNVPNGQIHALTFHGNGSNITHLDLDQGTNTGIVPMARGGTGTGSLTNKSIPYVNASGGLEESKIEYDATSEITSISSNVVISGNLTVQGNVTSQHSNDHYITDKIFAVAHGNAVDAKDMGQHMSRPTANVFAGFLGQTIGKEYTIAYTTSKSESDTVTPTMSTTDGYITANVWGNVLSGNVTTTGKVTADNLKLTGTGTVIDASSSTISAHTVNSQYFAGNFQGSGGNITSLNLGDAQNFGQVAIARGGTGVTTGLTVLDPAYLSSQVLLAKGGTGLTAVAENDLLLGPASGTALTKLSAYTGSGGTFPAVMSANSSGGNTASTSDSSSDAYKVFDGNDSTNYSCPEDYHWTTPYNYTGSNSLGGVDGEWVKIQLASAIAATSVFVKAKPDNQAPSYAGRPEQWRILGSNDNTTWTQLHSSTTIIDSASGTTESFTNTTAYTYFGFVVTHRNAIAGGGGGDHWQISRLSFTSPSGPTEKFLKSSAAGVSWDEVSSTLQTITDGGATTTQTVAFNNTTTGLTSAGDIDIAATKQIDYAGDVLLKSSAGAVASLKVTNAVKLDPAYAAPSNNVLSFNTTTGEIYDSGGQGGSSLDNIHEYNANVSIGPSVAAANLTINTYESNVLTVSGNVAADNITIGTLHVAASPFNLDDVASAGAGANVTSNVIQFTATGNAFVTTNNIKIGKDVHAGGNVYSQNLQLTNTQITSSFTTGSGTLTIDAQNKSYGTAPLTSIDADVAILDISNLPSGGQVVVPLLATGADRKVLKTITTGIDFIAFTSDVSIDQNGHALLTVSKIGASGAEKIYMNAVSFTAA